MYSDWFYETMWFTFNTYTTHEEQHPVNNTSNTFQSKLKCPSRLKIFQIIITLFLGYRHWQHRRYILFIKDSISKKSNKKYCEHHFKIQESKQHFCASFISIVKPRQRQFFSSKFFFTIFGDQQSRMPFERSFVFFNLITRYFYQNLNLCMLISVVCL